MKGNYHELSSFEERISFLVYHYGFRDKDDMVHRVLNKQFHGTMLETKVRELLFLYGQDDSFKSESLIGIPYKVEPDENDLKFEDWSTLGELL
jgi:hypothetical protein